MKTTSLKKLLFLFAILSVFGCNKKSDNEYYVKLKINGNWITWTTVAGELGPDLGDPTKTDFGITANNDAMNDVFDISIQVDGTDFNTGTYQSDNLTYWTVISYFKDATSANSRYYMIRDAPGQPSSKYTVNVTSITNTTLKGTFTGNYLYDDIEDETYNVTEGEFYVRRIR